MVQTPIHIEAGNDRVFSGPAFDELVGTKVELNGDAASGILVAAEVQDDGLAVTITVETDEEINGLREPVAVRLAASVEAHLAA